MHAIHTFIAHNRGQVPFNPFNNFVRNIEMKSIDKFVLVLVASLALLLAGCGGGSSTTTPPEDTGPTAEEMAAAAIMEAKGALTTAQGQLSGATTDAEMLAAYQAIHGAAQNLITVLGANGGSADDIVAATVARENASDMIASLTQKIADAADDAAAATLAAMIKEVGTKNAAMDAEAAQGPGQTPANPDAGLGGSVADGATTTYSMAISRDRSGTEVKITDTALNGDDDPKFMQTNVSDGLTKHVRTMKADDDGNVMEETVMVMTDIDAPKATAFAMVTGQALNARDLDEGTDADDDGTATNDFTALTVIDANVGNVMSSAFPTSRSGTLNFTGDTAATTSIDEAQEVRGTYNGAMGTYRCNDASGCTVVIGDTDTTTPGVQLGISSMTNWIFTPDADATSDVADPMYHHYGFWIKKTTDSDGVVTYNEVETFYGFTGVAANTDTSSAVGTAKYSGGALGVYTHKVLDSEGGSTAVSEGHFTADANLTATFGGASVAANDHNTVTGTIDNFKLAGGEANNWSVSLEGNDSDTNGSIVGTNTDGTVWSAQYYGASDATTNPAAILGEFNAAFANGQVAGAFGADLQDE